MENNTRYVIVTPVRDEEAFIEATIQCVCRQTVRPVQWVIVNDGSTDATGAIIDRYAAQFPWIQVVHRTNRGFRYSGAGVVEAFDDGYRVLECQEWDFIVKLDGDLSFSDDYFQRCFEHFRSEPALGVGGGMIYHQQSGEFQLEANPTFHVRGATKIYRRTCWETIKGLMQLPGWDLLDEIKANMCGWKSHSFAELHLIHHRLTGMADGMWRDRVKHGTICYVAGYHPLFVVASCLYRLIRKPYIVGSVAVCWGYLKAHVTGPPRVPDIRVIRYIRTQQLRRLCGLETIWK